MKRWFLGFLNGSVLLHIIWLHLTGVRMTAGWTFFSKVSLYILFATAIFGIIAVVVQIFREEDDI
jgi:uncharacterized membrane protein